MGSAKAHGDSARRPTMADIRSWADTGDDPMLSAHGTWDSFVVRHRSAPGSRGTRNLLRCNWLRGEPFFRHPPRPHFSHRHVLHDGPGSAKRISTSQAGSRRPDDRPRRSRHGSVLTGWRGTRICDLGACSPATGRSACLADGQPHEMERACRRRRAARPAERTVRRGVEARRRAA